MRKIVVVILFLVVVLPLKGQTLADDASSWAGEWKAAFSVDGRRKWKPEFTVRYSAGFISEGPLITGGVKIDDKRTLGLMFGQGCTTLMLHLPIYTIFNQPFLCAGTSTLELVTSSLYIAILPLVSHGCTR